MEPIGWPRVNKLAGIVSSCAHGCTDNLSKVPRLQNRARIGIHFPVHRFVVVLGISIQYQSRFAGIHIVVKITNSDGAVIRQLSESAVELDPEESRTVT